MSLITQPNPCGFLLALFIYVYVFYIIKINHVSRQSQRGVNVLSLGHFRKSCDLYKAPWPHLLQATT
jgi:hypothetical protein